MARPRRVIPAGTGMVSRRVIHQLFLLTPSKFVNQLLRFVIFVYALRYGIVLHAFTVMSNHWHAVLTDRFGLLPRFMEDVDKLVGRAMNARLGRRGYFWEQGSYSFVRAVTPEAVLDQIVYCMANPVDAGLVFSADSWAGLGTLPRDHDGRTWVANRPDFFFGEDTDLPEAACLGLERPAGFEHLSRQQWQALLDERLEARVAAARVRYEGKFLGRRAVLRQDPFSSPTTSAPHRNLNPRIATKDKEKRIAAIQEEKQFLMEYREARLGWISGDRTVVFPYGTYWYKHFSAAPVSLAPG